MMNIARSWWIAAALVASITACGGGNGEPEIVRLAVGLRVVDVERTEIHGLILRNVGRGWESVGEELLESRTLQEVQFASATVAWAFGNGTTLRSLNAGRTWHDATALLPQEVRDGSYPLFGITFANAATGYLSAIGTSPDTGLQELVVWVTRDGGETWSRVEELEPIPQGISARFAVRGGFPEIVRYSLAGEPGVVVEGFDGADYGPQLVTDTRAEIERGFVTAGAEADPAWIAMLTFPDGDLSNPRPAIFTSARPGGAWTPQALPVEHADSFNTIDMCADGNVGIAAGAEFIPRILPFVLRTENGGDRWERIPLEIPEGTAVADVLCVSPREIWLAAYEDVGIAFLRSDDGARTFRRVANPITTPHQIGALATNAGLP